MARSGLVALGAIALLLYGGCHHVVSRYEDRTTTSHTEARKAFLAELPQTDCLRTEDIVPLAQARGWETRKEASLFFCIRPDTVQYWLRVVVAPPLPFSTEDENSHLFAFDENGCRMEWEYASGPGSTCAE